MGVRITMAGQDITDWVDELSLDIESNLGQGPGVPQGASGRATTGKFDCYLGPQASAYGSGQTLPTGGKPVLVRQGEVIVYDSSGKRIFGGYATDFVDKTDFTVVKTQVTCSDYWQDLARVVINQIYTSAYDNQILADLFSTYAPGIDLSDWNQVRTYLFTKIYLRAKTMQESIQDIADTVGFDVWIDPYKKFQYRSPSNSGTAPFAVSDDPDFITSFPLAITNYEKDDTAIINRVYFYGGKTPSNDYTQDLSQQANGSNNTFVLAYYPRPSSEYSITTTDAQGYTTTTQIVYFTVNGEYYPLGTPFGSTPADTLISQGGTAYAILNSSAQTITVDPTLIPAAGATVHCTYRYEYPITVTATNTASHSYFGRWFDGTISDTTVLDKTTAIQRARVLLLEQAYGFEHITLHCWRPGLQAGMMLRIDHNVRGIHAAYIVQTVKIQPLGNGQFQYEVDLGAWNWNLVDVLTQAGKQGNLIDQTDLNDESQDVVNAEQVYQNLGAHFVWTPHVRTSGGYYARATALGDGHDAYCGLFTVTF